MRAAPSAIALSPVRVLEHPETASSTLGNSPYLKAPSSEVIFSLVACQDLFLTCKNLKDLQRGEGLTAIPAFPLMSTDAPIDQASS
jgi:hypothetical protein